MPGFNKHIDDYLVQQIITRLILPWRLWPAYKLGIIDQNGKVLKKKSQLKTKAENDAWGYLDILCCNLRKILSDYPTTRMRLAQLNLIQTANLPTTPGQPPTIPLSTLAGSFFLLKDEHIPDPENINDVRKRFEKFLDEGIFLRHHQTKDGYSGVEAIDNREGRIVGFVSAKGNKVRNAKVRQDLRGTGLAKRMYDSLQLKLGRTLHPDDNQTDAAKGFWRKRYKEQALFHEDAAANGVGGGAIAGVGIGPQGEPGRRKSILAHLRRKKLQETNIYHKIVRTVNYPDHTIKISQHIENINQYEGEAFDKNNKKIAGTFFAPYKDSDTKVYAKSMGTNSEWRRKGIQTNIHNELENHIGKGKIKLGGLLSNDAVAFYKNRKMM